MCITVLFGTASGMCNDLGCVKYGEGEYKSICRAR